MRREVFVSYSEADRACAFELVAAIEARGIHCWVAPRDITPASDWAAEIIDAIGAARVMVLVFSGHSNESPQVRREVERAVHKRVSVLPFRIEDVAPSKSLEYFLSTQHWLDAFPPPRDAHYARLCEHLAGLLAEAPRVPTGDTGTFTGTSTGSFAHALDPDLLAQVERALAGYIGPVARHLVRRAAREGGGFESLIAHLAPELEHDGDRHAFVDACRRLRPSI